MTESRFAAAAKAVGYLLVVTVGVALFFWMPLPDIDLPFDAPERPWWLRWLPFLVGSGKFVLLAVLAILVALSQVGKGRSGGGDGNEKVSLRKK